VAHCVTHGGTVCPAVPNRRSSAATQLCDEDAAAPRVLEDAEQGVERVVASVDADAAHPRP